MSSIEKAIDKLSKAKTVSLSSDRVKESKPETSSQAVDAGNSILREQERSAALRPDAKPQREDGTVDSQISQAGEGRQEAEPTDYLLDLDGLGKSGYLVPDAKNKQLSEEYRAIKRPVLMNAFGKGAAPVERGNIIAVTSSLPGEGKTYTSMNLALSIATELDSTVLLIDGDILKPQLSLLLGLESKRGLTDVLHDPNTDIKDVLVKTQIPKLKIIPAGNKYENSTELFASGAMERLVIELGNRYGDRVVLFDSPPLLATTEATVLNHLMGQILLVVEAGKTPIGAVKDSLAEIHEDKVVGLILNKTNASMGKGGYGSYGGYGRYG